MKDENGHNITIRDYVDRIFLEREKALDGKWEALEARLEKLNELRQEVMQDRGSYITREIFETRIGSVERRQSTATQMMRIMERCGSYDAG